MERIVVRDHIIWTGSLKDPREVEPISRDLWNAALASKNIHVVIFKAGEEHNIIDQLMKGGGPKSKRS
jgi:hypothetical protein